MIKNIKILFKLSTSFSINFYTQKLSQIKLLNKNENQSNDFYHNLKGLELFVAKEKNILQSDLVNLFFHHPEILKNHNIYQYLKQYLLKNELEINKMSLFLIKNLIFYTKDFTEIEKMLNWGEILNKSIKKLNDKNINIYELSFILCIYYESLKKIFKLQDKAHFYYKSEENKISYERNYRKIFNIDLINFPLFIDYIQNIFLFKLNNENNINDDEILYFFHEYLNYFKINNELFCYLCKFLEKNSLNYDELTQIYLNLSQIKNSIFPFHQFKNHINNIYLYIKNNENIINQITYRNRETIINNKNIYYYLFESTKENKKKTEILYFKNLIDIFWILTKNYTDQFNEISLFINSVLNKNLSKFYNNDLNLILYSKIMLNIQIDSNKKLTNNFNEEFLFILSFISKNKYFNFKNFNDTPLKMKKSYHLLLMSLKYLDLKGYKEIINKYISNKFYNELIINYKDFIVQNNNNSFTEKKIFNILKQIITKENLTIEKNKLIDIFICDIFISPHIIIEINGEHHKNLFYEFTKNDIINKYEGNFRVKIEILKLLNYNVEIISSDEYLPILHQNKLELYLKKLLNKNI